MIGRSTTSGRSSLPRAALCLAIISLLIVSCDEPPEAEAQDFLQSAQESLEIGDTNGAIIELKNALQKNPDSAEARILLGRIYLSAGDGTSAEKELSRAWELGIQDDEVQLLLTQARLKQGNYEGVLESVAEDEALESPLMQDLLMARGEALLGIGRTLEALELFQDIIARTTHPKAYGGLARATFISGERTEAMDHLAKGLELNPESAELHALSGQLNIGLRREAEADASFQRALELDSENLEALIGLSNLRIVAKDFEQAEEYLNRAAALGPQNFITAILISYVSLARKDYAKAEQLADSILAVDDSIMTALYVSGVSAYALKHFERSKSLLSRYMAGVPHDRQTRKILDDVERLLGSGEQDVKPHLLKQVSSLALDAGRRQFSLRTSKVLAESSPEDAKLRAGVSIAEALTGDMTSAENELLQALESDPSGQNRAVDQAVLILIIGQLQRGEFDKALDATSRLQARMPDLEISYILEGIAHTGKESNHEAKRAFQRALEINPGSPNAMGSLSALLMRQGRVDEATNVLQQVLLVEPDHYPTLLRLGLLYARQNRQDEAIEWLEKAAAVNADAIAPRVLLGRVFLESGDFQRVLQETGGALEKNPKDRRLLALSGSAKLGLGQNDEAAATLERLVEAAPGVAEAHYLLAAAYARLQDEEKVRTELEATLAIEPAHFKAQVTLARFLMGKNDLAAGKPIIEGLAQDHPAEFDVLSLRAELALREGRNEEAINHLREAHNLAKTSISALTLAQGQWRTGAREDGVATLASWLEGSPRDARNRLYLAQYHLALGRKDSSLTQFLKVIEDQPDSWLALNQAAWLLDQKGDYEAALKYAERAYGLAPNNPSVADTLAVILVKRDELKRALPLLAKANSQAPRDAVIAFHYAQALAKTGNKTKAVEILEGILAQDGEFSERDAARVLLEELRAN